MRSETTTLLSLALLIAACGEQAPSSWGDTGGPGEPTEPDPTQTTWSGQTTGTQATTTTHTDTTVVEPDEVIPIVPDWPEDTDPFADVVVSFTPGPDAGFGDEDYPDVVLGSPEGNGIGAGSLDVLSLGEGGSIILEMTDLEIIDGEGPDLLIFENPFANWIETGFVAVSEDGETWHEWDCEFDNPADGYPNCAGVGYVYANSEMHVDPTDPDEAGGDAFDLADLGLSSARFVRIRDSGANIWGYGGATGGFDLDAISASNWAAIDRSEARAW